MTYYGAEKVAPHYNVMGVAKAALEASVRYLAYDFGQLGVRVNAISAGPIRTLAAAGVSGFKLMYRQFSDFAPLHQNISIEDVGNTAVYLCSDLSAKTTGQVIYVDSGYNIVGVPEAPDEKFGDGKLARHAADRLASLAREGKSFFLGVGFARPHLPFIAPKRYWDLFDPAKLPVHPTDLR